MLTAFLIRVLNDQKEGFDEGERLTDILREVCGDFDIEVRHAGDYQIVGRISEQVLNAIVEADFVFADANSSNENVWYEIGYADKVLTEKVICLSHVGRVLPFDRHDIRSIRYGASADGYALLAGDLRKMVRELVCSLVLRRPIENDKMGIRETAIALEIVRRLQSPKLRTIGRDWLKLFARDSRNNSIPRRTAICTLAMLDELSDDLAVELTRPVVDEQVRSVVYEQLYQLRKPVDEAVWDCRSEDLRNQNLRDAFARAAARYWLDGRLRDEWFRERIEADMNVRSALLMALQELLAKGISGKTRREPNSESNEAVP
jgi:hypothetical protein